VSRARHARPRWPVIAAAVAAAAGVASIAILPGAIPRPRPRHRVPAPVATRWHNQNMGYFNEPVPVAWRR